VFVLRKRFSVFSASVMLVAAALGTLAVLQAQGDGFGGHRGFPFAWHEWHDVIIDGKVPSQYSWGALAADIVVWIAAILAFGLLVEYAAGRILRRREPGNAA